MKFKVVVVFTVTARDADQAYAMVADDLGETTMEWDLAKVFHMYGEEYA